MENKSNNGRILEGIVVSAKMNKTVVVAVKRLVKHPRYGKQIVRTKKYLVHDEASRAKEGDRVRIAETRPLSRRKSFTLI